MPKRGQPRICHGSRGMNMSLVPDIANQLGCGEYGHSSKKGCSVQAAKC